MRIRLHVNKHEIRKGAEGWPWVLHTSKKCIRAKKVIGTMPFSTEFKPEKPQNPKAFVVLEGEIKDLGKGCFEIIPAAPRRRPKVKC